MEPRKQLIRYVICFYFFPCTYFLYLQSLKSIAKAARDGIASKIKDKHSWKTSQGKMLNMRKPKEPANAAAIKILAHNDSYRVCGNDQIGASKCAIFSI